MSTINSTLVTVAGASLGAAAIVAGFSFLWEKRSAAPKPVASTSSNSIDELVALKVKEAIEKNASLFQARPSPVKSYPPVGRPAKQVTS